MSAEPQRSFPFDYSKEYVNDTVPSLRRLYKMLVRPRVVEAINAASSVVEVKWHTMWGATAVKNFAPAVGLKE